MNKKKTSNQSIPNGLEIPNTCLNISVEKMLLQNQINEENHEKRVKVHKNTS